MKPIRKLIVRTIFNSKANKLIQFTQTNSAHVIGVTVKEVASNQITN